MYRCALVILSLPYKPYPTKIVTAFVFLDKNENQNGKATVTIRGSDQSGVDNAAAEVREIASDSPSSTGNGNYGNSSNSYGNSSNSYGNSSAQPASTNTWATQGYQASGEDEIIDWQAAAQACVSTHLYRIFESKS